LRATTKSQLSTAYYVSNNGKVDPGQDFSFKIDFHYALQTDPSGWLSVGLTPNIDDVDHDHLEFGPGCGNFYSHIWYETVDGNRTPETGFIDRDETEGSLYVSYDAGVDKLYLSMTGYGAASAWHTVTGLLQGAWSGRSLWLYIGGGSDGLEIDSGDAYLDNFVLDAVGSATPTLSPVYRFWSPVSQSHFYTIDSKERDQVIKNYPQAWVYEGPVFQAAATSNAPGLAPVYRFWSLTGLGHFYTIDPAEKDRVIANYPNAWQLEGIAFYAYPEGAQPATSKPVYRLCRTNGGDHFYTIDTNERDQVLKAYPSIYTLEGVAFYAFP
jgi:hypothetical protein